MVWSYPEKNYTITCYVEKSDMFVIFDTNIWIKELGINTIKGQATKVYLHQKSATLALPEVVKLETEIHLN